MEQEEIPEGSDKRTARVQKIKKGHQGGSSEGTHLRLRSGKMVPQLSDDDTIELIDASSFTAVTDPRKKKVSIL